MFLRIMLMLAMVGALSAVGFVLLGNSPKTSTAEAAPVPMTGRSVLVAARNLPPGTLLREADVRWEKWALSDVPDGYLMRGREKEDAGLGSVVRRAFVAGEPLLSGQMVAPGERGFLAAVLTPGMRAVAVGVDAVSAASGLIWPGDRVDMILTQSLGNGDADPRRAVGETFLRDIRVLSIDQRLGEAMDGQAAPEGKAPRTVTLEVTQQQAEMLKVATGLGSIALSLRSLGADEKAASLKPTWASDVSAAHRRPDAPKQAAARPAAPKVEIVRGTVAK
jgi:pilus assembly protein CpaB